MNDLQIEYFLAVADNLSFTKTAAEKYVSQPAISKQIAAMEEELGVLLFERAPKSIKLTEAGQLFANFYRKHRQDLTSITQMAKQTHASRRLSLRIGCISGWTLNSFLPQILNNLNGCNKRIEITLESLEFQNLTAALNNEEIELAFILPKNIPGGESILSRKLLTMPQMIIYSQLHPVSAIHNPRPIDFQNSIFYIPAAGGIEFIIDIVKSICQPYGFTPRLKEVRNIETMLINVINGLGVAIVDEWTMKTFESHLRFTGLDAEHTIYAAWHKTNENPALAAFLGELETIFP